MIILGVDMVGVPVPERTCNANHTSCYMPCTCLAYWKLFARWACLRKADVAVWRRGFGRR